MTAKKTLLIPMIPFAAVIRKIEFMIPEGTSGSPQFPDPKEKEILEIL